MLASSDSYSSQDSAMDSVPSNKTVADTIGLKSFYTASNEMKVFKTSTLGLLNHLLICPHNALVSQFKLSPGSRLVIIYIIFLF